MFKCQELSMFLKIDRVTCDKCDILPLPRKGKYINFDTSHTVVSEWDFKTILAEFGQTDPKSSKSGKVYPKVSVYIKVSRQWQASIGLILVVFCLFTLAVGMFSLELTEENLGDRLGYAITLLLSDVACNQLLYDNLPNIPYATLFDYYIYTSFVYIFLATSWTFVGGIMNLYLIDNSDNINTDDDEDDNYGYNYNIDEDDSYSYNSSGSGTSIKTRTSLKSVDFKVFLIFALSYICVQLFFVLISFRIRKYQLSTIEKFPFEIESNEDNLPLAVRMFIRGRNTDDRSTLSINWDANKHLNEDDYDTDKDSNCIFAKAVMTKEDDDD